MLSPLCYKRKKNLIHHAITIQYITSPKIYRKVNTDDSNCNFLKCKNAAFAQGKLPFLPPSLLHMKRVLFSNLA
jgi:hypothetical protein